jgi:hypothetical protein
MGQSLSRSRLVIPAQAGIPRGGACLVSGDGTGVDAGLLGRLTGFGWSTVRGSRVGARDDEAWAQLPLVIPAHAGIPPGRPVSVGW